MNEIICEGCGQYESECSCGKPQLDVKTLKAVGEKLEILVAHRDPNERLLIGLTDLIKDLKAGRMPEK